MRILLMLGFVLAYPLTAYCQIADVGQYQKIDDRFEKFVKDQDISGAVLHMEGKSANYQRAIGLANIQTQAAMKEDTLFRIASMTKPITAIAIMMLQDEGKLKVTDAVEKHLPEFRGQMLIDSKTDSTLTLKKPPRPIQIRDLLTHTSGLSPYPAGIADVYTKRNRTLSETTIAVSQLPLLFDPGSKWAYSNSGMDTLGRIVEVISGDKYEDFLQKRLFDPLEMKDTTFYPSQEQLKRTAITYNKKAGRLVEAPNTLLDVMPNAKHPVPAGGLFSTAQDLAKLYNMMLAKGTWNNRKYLSQEAVAEMTQTQTDSIKTGFVEGMSFGYGWAVVKKPQGVTSMLSEGTYGHGGAFGTQGWIDPNLGRIFIMLIQRTGLANGDNSEMRKEFQRLAVDIMMEQRD